MFKRIKFGDAHRIRDHGACGGATARPHHHAVGLRPVDVVGHDEEVAAELHLADHAAFVVGLPQHFERRLAVVPAFQAFLDLLQEQRRLVPAFRTVELRHERAVFMIVEHDVAAFGDLQRVVARFGKVFEQFAHFLGGFDVVAGAVEFESARLVQRGAGVDAQHGVLRAGVFGTRVMGIVGGQQRRVELFCDVEQPVGHLLFDFQAVVHEFDVEIIAAENVLEFAGGTQRVIELAQAQTSLDDARRAAGRGDDAFRIFGEDFLIHTRIAHDSAFKVRVGGGFHEVDEAFVVFCPHGQVGDDTAAGHIIRVTAAMQRIQIRIPVGVPAHTGGVLTCGFRRHIGFDADDRLDAGVDRGAPHLIRAMHVAVVGDADGRHAQFLGALDQIRYFRCAVEQRIMRVIMQLHEICGSSHAFQFSWAS